MSAITHQSVSQQSAGVADVLPTVPFETRVSTSVSYALDEGGKLFMGTGEVNKTLKRITAKLNELNIPYAVAGGMAMVAHGYVRFTDDVDILVTREGLTQLHDAVDGLGWVRPFQASKNLRDVSTGVKIEFLIAGEFPGDGKPKPVAFPQPAEVAREVQGIQYLDVPTLINLKLASYMTGADRAKDLGDVQELMKAKSLGRELADQLHPYVRPLYIDLCERLEQTSRPFVKIWQCDLPESLPSSGPQLVEALVCIDASLAPLFADGVAAELVPGKRHTHVKLSTYDRKVAQKHGMVDESELLLD
jgi:hypothetical protein